MSRALPWFGLIGLGTVLYSSVFCAPHFLGDKNGFLKGFVNHEFLALLGVIVTITLASAANLHLEFNKLQESSGEEFAGARKSVKRSAQSLLILFLAAFILVVVKGSLPEEAERGLAFINSSAILIVYFNIMVMSDLTSTIFKIPPSSK